MKNVYYPDNDDVLDWANGPTQAWPESDWDFHVIDGPHDDLIFSMINNAHKKSSFFLHCLYLLAGEALVPEQDNIEKNERLDRLLNMVTENSKPELIKWKRSVEEVRFGSKAFVSSEWFNADIDF